VLPLVCPLNEARGGPRSAGGVVVEEVRKKSAGEKAGVQPGDAIERWERSGLPATAAQEARGTIGSPFDLAEVETEYGPRGEVRLIGRRGGRPLTFSLAPLGWGIVVRAGLSEPGLGQFQKGKEAIEKGDLAGGAAVWSTLADRLIREGRREDGCWVMRRLASAFEKAKQWDDVQRTLSAAADMAPAGRPVVLARLHQARGKAFIAQQDLAKAQAAYQMALDTRLSLKLENLGTAEAIFDLGVVGEAKRDLDEAEQNYRRALQIRERLAPDSLAVAAALNNLGNIEWYRGRLGGAEQYFRRTLAIREKVAPNSLLVAGMLNNLGAVAWASGDLPGAEGMFRRALEIYEAEAADGAEDAFTLNNLGLVYQDRGDLAAAEECFKKYMARIDIGGPDAAAGYNNLGKLALMRGDLASGEDFVRKALAVHEKVSAESLDTAGSLSNLATVIRDRGEPVEAEAVARRAITILEKVGPESLELAGAFNVLGEAQKTRGDLAGAEESFKRCLALEERVAPRSLHIAQNLGSLGELYLTRKDPKAAEEHFGRALELFAKLAPASTDEAKVLHDLGRVARLRGDRDTALSFYERAIDTLEAQKSRLGGSQDVKAGFAAQYQHLYWEYLDLLLELGRSDEAIHVLERSRAQAFLALLAERDLVFSEVPADLDKERRAIDAQYDQTQAGLAQAGGAGDDGATGAMLQQLRELREKRADVAARIRAASPHFASLRYPTPLKAAQIREALDAKTALLAYAVGPERTHLFVVRGPEPGPQAAPRVQALTLPVGEASLREGVRNLRSLIERRDAARLDLVTARAEELYDTLVRPAEGVIGDAERLLILPDGPLHTLPFAALVRAERTTAKPSRKATAQTGRRQFLVEWKPVHVALSVTVYEELKKSRASEHRETKRVAAFGDPSYASVPREDGAVPGDLVVRSALRRGLSFEPLPASRAEVEAIAALHPGQVLTFLGDQATEEKAKLVGRDVRFLHFACHAFLDENQPLDSALVLSLPDAAGGGRENGLLQAWEIFEGVRIEAELVSLSACQSGLGKEVGGEGLLGLTRAFQYAGARSVLASLWSVADATTAELMKRFYSQVAAGRSKDEALRLAQLELIRKPLLLAGEAGTSKSFDASHPYYWAAFQLFGDWR
jgi:CHAT domain-containing protein/Tfp pilus assembly protein PilF